MSRARLRLYAPLAVCLVGCAIAQNSRSVAGPPGYAQQTQSAQQPQETLITGSTAQQQREVPSQTYPAVTDSQTVQLDVAPMQVDGNEHPQSRVPSSNGAIFSAQPTRPPAPVPAAAPPMPGATAPATPRVNAPAPIAPSGQAPHEQLSRWESLLERDRNALLAGLSACRDICAAASNICVASREICRLTGNDPAEDHCARARAACADAGHRRDAACAVCP